MDAREPKLPQMAVFIDYENMVASARDERLQFSLDEAMEVLRARGRPVLVRAYGDWAAYPSYPEDLRRHAVELHQLYRYGTQQKNRADIYLAVQAMEALYTRPNIEVFVILAGDADYAPLVAKLREAGKRVIGVGIRGHTSPLLVETCDEFLYYDALVGATASIPIDLFEVLRLVERALSALQQSGESAVSVARLRQAMQGLDPTFSDRPLIQQYGSLERFLEQHADRFRLERRNGAVTVALRQPEAQPAPAAEPSTVGHPERPVGRSGTPVVPPPRSQRVAQCQDALQRLGWSVFQPQVRAELVRGIFERLPQGAGEARFAEIVADLAERYGPLGRTVAGQSVDRGAIEELVRAVWQTGLIEPVGELGLVTDPVRLSAGVTLEALRAAVERVYLEQLRQAVRDLDPALAAEALLGDPGRSAEVAALLAERPQVPARERPARAGTRRRLRDIIGEAAYRLAGERIEAPPEADAPPLAAAARRLFERGQELRSQDFRTGARLFLQAAQLGWAALQGGDLQASAADLRWYVASYFSAEAGARYVGGDFEGAIPYYLAYFSMLQQGDRLWEDVFRLTSPMLSYYLALAARMERVEPPVSPNSNQPGDLAALLSNHRNPRVVWRWRQLAEQLAAVSPDVARDLLERIERSSAPLPVVQRAVEQLRGLLPD